MLKQEIDFESLKRCKSILQLKAWMFRETKRNALLWPTIEKVNKCENFNEALKIVWDYALQLETGEFNGKTAEKNCWFKGSAIHGMECHSR